MPRGIPKVPRQKPPEDVCAFKFTTFPAPIGHVNGKNVAALFGKSDAQSWWAKRKSDSEYDLERKEKRRRLLAPQENVEIRGGGAKGSLARLLVDEPSPVRDHSNGAPAISATAMPEDNALASDPAHKTIIIHPGSKVLRIGRASDANPLEVANVIARRTKTRTGTVYSSSQVPREDANGVSSLDSTALPAKIEALRTIFRSRMRQAKLRGPTGAKDIAASFNAAAEPEYLEQSETQSHAFSTTEDFVVGEHALRAVEAEQEGFTLQWPLMRGQLNTQGYTCIQHVVNDIQDIWSSILQVDFEIPIREFSDYSVVLLVPDMPDLVYLREMSTLILRTMGFRQLCIQQESICSMLGMGLSTACVIDIGATKTAVCCVEEGWIVPESRIVLNYGNDDITEFYAAVLKQANFPYKELDISRVRDWHLVETLKEENCVLMESEVNLRVSTFEVRRPNHPIARYTIKLYDEDILGPMCLFAPRVIDFERKLAGMTKTITLDDEELDEVLEMGGSQITAAMRSCVKHLITSANAVLQQQQMQMQQQTSTQNQMQMSASQQDGSSLAVPETASALRGVSPALSPLDTPMTESRPSSPRLESPKVEVPQPQMPAPISEADLDIPFEAGKVPLDLAVMESICSTISEDRIKKFCNAIIVVGGGGRILGVNHAVQSRIKQHVEERYPGMPAELVNVIPALSGVDERTLAWKGISILTKLDVSSDVFVRADDYERLGMKAFKDRNAFL